jgi:hypothetical protein
MTSAHAPSVEIPACRLEAASSCLSDCPVGVKE